MRVQHRRAFGRSSFRNSEYAFMAPFGAFGSFALNGYKGQRGEGTKACTSATGVLQRHPMHAQSRALAFFLTARPKGSIGSASGGGPAASPAPALLGLAGAFAAGAALGLGGALGFFGAGAAPSLSAPVLQLTA